jgi:undecaprenyl-diphosphatase
VTTARATRNGEGAAREVTGPSFAAGSDRGARRRRFDRLGSIDRRLQRGTRALARRTPSWHPPARTYASTAVLSFGGVVTLAGVRALVARDPVRLSRVLATSIGCTVALGAAHGLARALHRDRPFVANRIDLDAADPLDPVDLAASVEHTALISHDEDSSFPSDHATLAAAIATGLCLADPPLGRFVAVAAAAMAFDRVYLGVHYPSDVAAGLALGAGVSYAASRLASPRLERLTIVQAACGKSRAGA